MPVHCCCCLARNVQLEIACNDVVLGLTAHYKTWRACSSVHYETLTSSASVKTKSPSTELDTVRLYVQGNCSAAAVSPADFAFQYLGNAKIEEREIGEGSTQCLLIADASFLKTESRIWLDNLYIRMLAPTRQGGSAAPRSSGVVAEGQSQDIRKFTFMTVTGDEAALYMTSVTLQVCSAKLCAELLISVEEVIQLCSTPLSPSL